MLKSWHIFAGPIKYFYNIAKLVGYNFPTLQRFNITTRNKNGRTN